MKIIFITTIGSAWGGSEELWSQAALRLKEIGYSISASLGFFGQVHPKVQKLMAAGIRVRFRKNKISDAICLGMERFGHSLFRGLINNSFENHIKEEKPDMVVFSQATCFGAYELMLYCKKKGVPYCSVSQLNTEFEWPKDANVAQIREAFHSAKAAFFVSEGNLELFQLQIAEKLLNAFVIPNAYNFKKVPILEWPKEDCLQIAHVARLDFSHKGTDILLKCFAEPQWAKRNFCLNIYGKGNEQLARNFATYCGTHKVKFWGQVEEIKEIWNKNHLLVLPSRYEGMPLSLIEAMYCGRPSVVTDVAGHRELIVEGISGYIADAPTQKHFSQALEKAWAQKKNWEQMGKEGKERILNLYTTDPVSVFTEKLIKAIR